MTDYERKRFDAWLEYKDAGHPFGTPIQDIYFDAFNRGYELGMQDGAKDDAKSDTKSDTKDDTKSDTKKPKSMPSTRTVRHTCPSVPSAPLSALITLHRSRGYRVTPFC